MLNRQPQSPPTPDYADSLEGRHGGEPPQILDLGQQSTYTPLPHPHPLYTTPSMHQQVQKTSQNCSMDPWYSEEPSSYQVIQHGQSGSVSHNLPSVNCSDRSVDIQHNGWASACPSSPASRRPASKRMPKQRRNTTTGNIPYNRAIYHCLLRAPDFQLTLGGIYEAVKMNFPQKWNMRNEHASKNSVRHNLSMNTAFERGTRMDPDNEEGSWWHLSAHAVAHGIEPTTRYRTNGTKRKTNGKKSAGPKPAKEAKSKSRSRTRSAKKRKTEALETRSDVSTPSPILAVAAEDTVSGYGSAYTPSVNMSTPSLDYSTPNGSTGRSNGVSSPFDGSSIGPYFMPNASPAPTFELVHLSNGLTSHPSSVLLDGMMTGWNPSVRHEMLPQPVFSSNQHYYGFENEGDWMTSLPTNTSAVDMTSSSAGASFGHHVDPQLWGIGDLGYSCPTRTGLSSLTTGGYAHQQAMSSSVFLSSPTPYVSSESLCCPNTYSDYEMSLALDDPTACSFPVHPPAETSWPPFSDPGFFYR